MTDAVSRTASVAGYSTSTLRDGVRELLGKFSSHFDDEAAIEQPVETAGRRMMSILLTHRHKTPATGFSITASITCSLDRTHAIAGC